MKICILKILIVLGPQICGPRIQQNKSQTADLRFGNTTEKNINRKIAVLNKKPERRCLFSSPDKYQRFESVPGTWFFIIVLSKNAVACEGSGIHFFLIFPRLISPLVK